MTNRAAGFLPPTLVYGLRKVLNSESSKTPASTGISNDLVVNHNISP